MSSDIRACMWNRWQDLHKRM
ncbi:unnamed protein product [Leptidea sinapis]|uniref:Uncharacterized protein n=1 Tax=Leptidea sinapis TaxID=189913 RepID=A0A5E4Q927_9NEOP|nr:unnamed protein product [Leptidea sinapis]